MEHSSSVGKDVTHSTDTNDRNAVEGDLCEVIAGIESDLNDALSKLHRAERTIKTCQNRLVILKERDDMPSGGNR